METGLIFSIYSGPQVLSYLLNHCVGQYGQCVCDVIYFQFPKPKEGTYTPWFVDL